MWDPLCKLVLFKQENGQKRAKEQKQLWADNRFTQGKVLGS